AIDALAALRLADQRLVEEQVVEDRLIVLAHAGIASVGFSSSTSARFTRMITSDSDSGVIVTPTRWSASFRLTLRRVIWTNCAVALFRLVIRVLFLLVRELVDQMDQLLALSLEPLEFVLQLDRARLLRVVVLEGPQVDRAKGVDRRLAVGDRRLEFLEAREASLLQLDRHLLHHAFGLGELLFLDLALRLHLQDEVLFRVA